MLPSALYAPPPQQALFFPACQCQEPIKEQWWGNNAGMDQAIVFQSCSLRNRQQIALFLAEIIVQFDQKSDLENIWK